MAYIYDMVDTWNNVGTTYTAIKMNATDTASAAGSLLLDLQIGGSSKTSVTKTGEVRAGNGSSSAPSLSFLNSTGTGFYLPTTNVLGATLGSAVQMRWTTAFLAMNGALAFGFSAGNPNSTDPDARIYRDAAGILALRNGATAHSLRWYRTFTDASNYERGALKSQSGIIEIAAETAGTGTANLDLQLTPAGTGTVRFGTYSALSGESVTGYITVKDSAGNSRKLAVVS